MKKIFFGTLLAIGLAMGLSTALFAEVIYLKAGGEVRGKILEKTDKKIKVDVKGITLTYYAEDVDRVESDDTLATSPANEPKSLSPISDTTDKALTQVPVPKGPREIVPKPQLPQAQGGPVTLPAMRQPETVRQAGPLTSQDPRKMSLPTAIPETEPAPSSVDSGSPIPVDSSLEKMSKYDLIVGLIEASGAKRSMAQMFDQILSQAPPEEKQKIEPMLKVDDIIKELVPVYSQYFNETELKGLISFYRSPLGQKLLTVTPKLMEDSMKTSLEYFKSKMPAEMMGSGQAPKLPSKN